MNSLSKNRCVNMIARLFNAPMEENETAVGVSTVGSSEAMMLAGLAFKRKWQNKRKAEGKPYDNPNIVTGANVQVIVVMACKHLNIFWVIVFFFLWLVRIQMVAGTDDGMQVCWEKFATYFEVELKEVKLREDCYVMDPVKAVEMVDENTICVAAILGSTFTGEFEDVKLLNHLLIKKNKITG